MRSRWLNVALLLPDVATDISVMMKHKESSVAGTWFVFFRENGRCNGERDEFERATRDGGCRHDRPGGGQ